MKSGWLRTHDWNFHKGRGLERSKRLLGEGLLTSEGELHRRQRRLAQPAFHAHRIANYAVTMGEYAARNSARWQDGATVDISREMMRLALSIVGKTLFDAEIESESQEIGAALTTILEMFNAAGGPLSDFMDKLPLPRNRRFEQARQRLNQTIDRIIQEHRASGRDRGDLLSMLMMAQDESGGGMSDELLQDEAMTLMLAGHETTANALTWTWYLLCPLRSGAMDS